jgi:hypothetical protein
MRGSHWHTERMGGGDRGSLPSRGPQDTLWQGCMSLGSEHRFQKAGALVGALGTKPPPHSLSLRTYGGKAVLFKVNVSKIKT